MKKNLIKCIHKINETKGDFRDNCTHGEKYFQTVFKILVKNM